MPVYTVHEPPPRRDEAAADPVRFQFVRDGFYFWAFLLGPLWMLWRRLWLVLLLFVVGWAILQAGLWYAGATSGVRYAVWFLVALLVGLEASTLRRWTLARRGWTTVGLVAAEDAEDAERRFFAAWSRRAPRTRWDAAPASTSVHQPAQQQPPSQQPVSQQPVVLGLFPEPGAPR